MRIQTRGNSTTVWLSSDAGVINGTMTLSAPALERILQAVNEKYGTSFEGWSQLPTAYEVGDTVTNWNAYEKIEMPINGWFKTLVSGNVYTYGKVESNVLTLYGKINEDPSSELGLPIVSGVGKITSFSLHKSFKDVLSQRIGNITQSYIVETSLNIGDDVENWNEMTLVE